MVQKQAKQVLGLGVACRLIRYRYRRLFIEKPGIIEVSTTVASEAEAKEIATAILDQRLAACVQIIPGVSSYYLWQGEREVSAELLLIIKTTMNAFGRLTALIKRQHSYDLPEIVARQISDASTEYRQWVIESVDE
jgi:periplasmic divalent cation tolerance protein